MFSYLHLKKIIFIVAIFCATETVATERDEEIRNSMWNSSDTDFNVVNIPLKWKNASAVIIAQQNSFQYKKPIILNELHFNQYHHFRLKLNDKNAVNSYSELSFSTDGKGLSVYVGFKIIKPDGNEFIVDPATAVEMERTQNGRKESYKKIAIPNLEPGDILDYYIAEERVIRTDARIYYFDPVLHLLPRKYPVIKQKLRFDVQRRSFISLRSLNGAPEPALVVDEKTDEQHYILEDSDREAVPELRWFFPYRELPAIKFRAAYASGKAVRQNDVLLGEPGDVKKSVTKKELTNFIIYLRNNLYADYKPMHKYVKKNSGKDAGNFDMAKGAYGYQRNASLAHEEVQTVGWEMNEHLNMAKDSPLLSMDRFATFLAVNDIPFEEVIVIPKDISSLDDLLLEHELRMLIRVKDGDDYLYISPIDNHSIPGDIDGILEGADAYVYDGLADYKDWDPKRIQLPISRPESNMESGDITVKIGDNFEHVDLSVKRSLKGHLKPYHQYMLLDYYDYEAEERERYEMAPSFKGALWLKNNLETLKGSYLASRDKNRNNNVKAFVGNEYSFEIEDVTGFNIEQTGRFEETPEMVYTFNAKSKKLISKVGQNFLLDIGLLIENQVKIAEDELDRKHNVYFSYPRSYKYNITLEIPAGYKVQGLENLKYKVENKHGGFVSTASIKNGKVVIETYKHYDSIEVPAQEWPQIVDFLNAAHSFTGQKLLFKKG